MTAPIRIGERETKNQVSTRAKSKLLFPDTKSAEDAVQEVVGVNGADHCAQLVQRAAKLHRQDFRRLLKKDNGMCSSQVIQ